VDKVQSVIRRKAEAGRVPPEAAPMTAARALGLALAKAAQDGMALPLRVTRIEERRLSLAELPEAIEDRALLAVLEGPAEGLGLAAIAPSLLAALIEVQTTGRLSPAPPAARRATRTDAVMVAGFIDHALAGFEEILAELPEIVWAGGFRYASYLDDPRPLGLLLEDIAFRVLQLDLALGQGGERTGGLVLALPANGRGAAPRPAAGANAQAGAPAAGSLADAKRWSKDMERVVLQAPAVLDAVLHRLTLPLSAVLALAPGAELPVPLAALEDLRVEGQGGRLLARGRLGQNRGFRAVRLVNEAAEPAPAAPALATAATEPASTTPPRRRAAPPPDIAPEPAPQRAMPAPMAMDMIGAGPAAAADPAPEEHEPFAMAPLKMGSVF